MNRYRIGPAGFCFLSLLLTGCPPMPPPSTCEDVQVAECPAGQFRQFDTGVCCAPAPAGECVDIPEACTMEYAPVCGCDGKTYSNRCAAASAGVNVLHEDVCWP